MVGNLNVHGIGQLGNKSPNLQMNAQQQAAMQNNMGGGGPVGMNAMQMSIANNGTQSMGSMQGKFHFVFILLQPKRMRNIKIN